MRPPAHGHRVFPAPLAFLLANPLRRRFHPPGHLVDLLAVGPADAVVDFGCGPGFYSVELARRAGETIGVDVSPAMLGKARRAAQKAGVRLALQQSDGAHLPLASGSVDLILLAHVFHEIAEKRRALEEFERILKPDGRVAILERTRAGRFRRLLPGPPVVRPADITEAAALTGLVPGEVRTLGNDCLLFLRKAGSPTGEASCPSRPAPGS